MGSTKLTVNYQNINDGYAAASGVITSAVTDITNKDNIFIQVNALSGDAISSTVTVQGSLDYRPGTGGTVLNAGHWFNLPTIPTTITIASAPLTVGASVQPTSVPFIRTVITEAGASDGYYDAFISCKSV